VRAAGKDGAVTGRPSRQRAFRLACLQGAAFLALAVGPATAQPRSQFGSIGLIDMPSARMAPDGEFGISAAFFEKSQRYSLNFQALPWLETSFRYSGLTTFHPEYPVYFDRAFGLKVRLWDEGDILPALAIGTNDLVGTGIYSSEYLVASKSMGDLDFTLGIGWGRLATANTIRNPLSLISKSFDKRSTDFGLGGNFDFGRYFHGRNAGFFGGVSWDTPAEGLTLLAEYSSDKYVEETASGNFRPRSQFNLGASYRVMGGVTLGMGWLYGRSVYGNITLSLDPTADDFPSRLGPAPTPPSVRSESEQTRALRAARARASNIARPSGAELVDILWARPGLQNVALNGEVLVLQMTQPSPSLCDSLARQIAPFAGDVRSIEINGSLHCTLPPVARREDFVLTLAQISVPSQMVTIDATGPVPPSRAQAEATIRRKIREQNILLRALSLGDGEALVYYENRSYQSESDVTDRLLRILMADAPAEIEVFRLFPVVMGMPRAQIEIPRGTAERSFSQQGDYNIFRDQGRYTTAPMDNPVLAQADRNTFPRFNWSIFPQFRQQFFDPSNPLGVQFVAGGEASVEILSGFRIIGQAEMDLFNTFTTTRISDSVLPHVRTDFVRYFSEGRNGIGALLGEYSFRLTPETFVTLRGGYLESMFAGVGGEILWQPTGQRWALGADLYHVKQRDFDRLFGLRNYEQTTGHLTFYYQSPWANLDFSFRIGRYLAGDWGTTAQVTRRFASGVEIGVFATKTNVSSQQFGEGSFDKGIIIRIPLSHIMPINTQQLFAMDLRPIQRDGGQTLTGDAVLYEVMRRSSEGEFVRTSGF